MIQPIDGASGNDAAELRHAMTGNLMTAGSPTRGLRRHSAPWPGGAEPRTRSEPAGFRETENHVAEARDAA
jgi:hypothetical protein